MSAKITELIDKFDRSEIVRDKIAEILLVESTEQQALATAAGKDPKLWALRVFTGRSHPWSEFQDSPDQLDATPIVNVGFTRSDVDLKGSDVVERQKYDGKFWVECYGYGVSADSDDGHTVGDAVAEFEVHRAARLVRNILMAGTYTYLDLRQKVGGRMVESIEIFNVPIDAQHMQNIRGARITLGVSFIEFSPQVQGETIEIVSAVVRRAETGEILLTAQYEQESS